MKNIRDSLLLTLQFFTAVPIHKELQLSKKTVTGMLSFLPWTGALGGVIGMVFAYLLSVYGDWSALLIAFVIIAWMALFTGGLHLDGLIDTADAFFSYRDTEKRLEILSDSRVGAFGAMTLMFFLLGKLVILQELFSHENPPFWAIAILPLLARVGMSLFMMTTPCAKETGLGYFFKQRTNVKFLITASIVTMVLAIVLVRLFVDVWVAPVLIALALLLFVAIYRRWALKNFNGLSGDLLGAFNEGAELGLWVLLLLFI